MELSVPVLPVSQAYRAHVTRKTDIAAGSVFTLQEEERLDDLMFFASRIGSFVTYRYGQRANPLRGQPPTPPREAMFYVEAVDMTEERVYCHGGIQLRLCQDGKWRRTYNRQDATRVDEDERYDFALISNTFVNPMWTHRQIPSASFRPGAVIGQREFPESVPVRESPGADYADVVPAPVDPKLMRPVETARSLQQQMAGMRLSVRTQSAARAEGQ